MRPEIAKYLHADDSLAYTPEGFFDGSPTAGKYVAWRMGDELEMSPEAIARFRQPAKIQQALNVGGGH